MLAPWYVRLCLAVPTVAAFVGPAWSGPARGQQSYYGHSSRAASTSLMAATITKEVAAAPARTDNRVGDVLSQLSQVMDPDLGADIVSLGFIKNLTIDVDSRVSFVLELTTPACPVKDELKSQCVELVSGLPWVSETSVILSARRITGTVSAGPRATGLSKVANIIAVSSCKGGVGKSTTAVNLAFALERQGARVGILDADIYGPSLPTMVTPDTDVVEFVESQIRPMIKYTGVDAEGNPRAVKLMSFGYVNPGAAAIMRGPMVIQLINQLLTLTSWDELDYLILDMPPGTGDIPLTLCQAVNITAAVIVTTPQRLSFTDVVKGVDMFDTVNVPCVAVVENMAYSENAALAEEKNSVEGSKAWADLRADVQEVLSNEGGDVEVLTDRLLSTFQRRLKQDRVPRRLFGRGHKQRLGEMWGITSTVSLPLLEDISQSGDSGRPLMLEHPDSPAAAVFLDLAGRVVREVAKLQHDKSRRRPHVTYSPGDNKITVQIGTDAAAPQLIHPPWLRRKCRCALCVEEMTGRQLLREEDVPETVKPLEIAPVGNYAVAVTWSDGHKSLYPYRSFVEGYDR